jgi:hypothetical protein
MSETTNRPRFQFSLKLLLLVIALLAVIIGAYSFGYRRGYSTAIRESQTDYVIFRQP